MIWDIWKPFWAGGGDLHSSGSILGTQPYELGMVGLRSFTCNWWSLNIGWLSLLMSRPAWYIVCNQWGCDSSCTVRTNGQNEEETIAASMGCQVILTCTVALGTHAAPINILSFRLKPLPLTATMLMITLIMRPQNITTIPCPEKRHHHVL